MISDIALSEDREGVRSREEAESEGEREEGREREEGEISLSKC